ncbi:MAG: helix-turn-helix domain-containing protein [bacterium]
MSYPTTPSVHGGGTADTGKDRAARELGISTVTLWRKMKKHGIEMR